MIRWLVMLGVGLYLALQVGGEDRGQVRAGLRDEDEILLPAPPVDSGSETAATLAVATEAPAPAVAPRPAAPVPASTADVTLTSYVPTPSVVVLPRPERGPEPGPEAELAALSLADLADAPALDGTEDEVLSVGVIAASGANVRSGPGKDHGVVAQLRRGEDVLITAIDGGWARIRVEGDGIDGYVALSLIKREEPAAD